VWPIERTDGLNASLLSEPCVVPLLSQVGRNQAIVRPTLRNANQFVIRANLNAVSIGSAHAVCVKSHAGTQVWHGDTSITHSRIDESPPIRARSGGPCESSRILHDNRDGRRSDDLRTFHHRSESERASGRRARWNLQRGPIHLDDQ